MEQKHGEAPNIRKVQTFTNKCGGLWGSYGHQLLQKICIQQIQVQHVYSFSIHKFSMVD